MPWGDYTESKQAARVAEYMGKGATDEDALDLPLLDFNSKLMFRTAEVTAEPARMKFEMARAKRQSEEEKERQDALND